jgi:geranylgeranyl pyrophosphate synthase
MISTLDSITSLFTEIRERIETSARGCEWADFEAHIASHLTLTSLPPHVILPVASAAAVGGEPRRGLSAAVACAYVIVASRWFDDAQDRDRPESLWSRVGMGRAINMAATALMVAWRALVEDDEMPSQALHAFGKRTIELARGQDLDLAGGIPRTLGDYWALMRGKTGAALALGCEVGALAARPEHKADADICGRFGEHLGVLLQILDDLDGVFHPDGVGDLRAGKVTLPVLYGLAIDHVAREELAKLTHDGLLPAKADRVLEILEAIDTREFLVWCAFEERRQALTLLEDLEPTDHEVAIEGRRALRALADSFMVGWEDLISEYSRGRARFAATQ